MEVIYDGEHFCVPMLVQSRWEGEVTTTLNWRQLERMKCTFGILKKRWKILDYGLKNYCMKDCEKVYTVCCVLHNVLLGLDENFGISCVAQRGCPSTGDSQWLEGPEPRGDDSMVHG